MRQCIGMSISVLGLILLMPTLAAAVNRVEALDTLRMVAPRTVEAPPDFVLPRVRGRPIRLRAFAGRVVLLNFRATVCPPCMAETPGLQAIDRVFREKGLIVIAVNVKEADEDVREFVEGLHIGFPVALDRDGAVARTYEVSGLPTTVLIDRRGHVVGRAVGGRDWTVPAALHLILDLLREPDQAATSETPQ